MNEMYARLIKAIQLRDSADKHAILRAVLEAMREPTEEMKKAAAKIDTSNLERDIWQSMIDEILK